MNAKSLGYKLLSFNAVLSWAVVILGLVGLGLASFAVVGLVGIPSVQKWLLPFLAYLAISFLLLVDGVILKRVRSAPSAAFTYFAGTRFVLALVIAAYGYLQAGNFNSAYLFPVLVVAWALFVLATAYSLFKDNRVVLKLAMVLLACVCAIAVSGYVVAVISGYVGAASGKRTDAQTSYDFQLLRQDIQSDALQNNGMLPAADSLKSIAQAGFYSQSAHVALRVAKYTYIPLQNQGKFELCATFYTDTMGNYQPQLSGGLSDDESFHHAGYQCIIYLANS